MSAADLIAATLWHGVSRRAGDVLDSRRGSVRWSADDADQAFDVVAAGLPTTRVTFRLAAVTATIGAVEIELDLGSRTVRRASFGAAAELGEHTYRIQQRGRRLAELDRGTETIGVLARPRRGSRSVNWAMAIVSDEEIALGHALALATEIGSPGAVANLASVLPF